MSTAPAATTPTTTIPAPSSPAGPPPPAGPPAVDNRPAHLAWGLAWFLGYGAFAVGGGGDPVTGPIATRSGPTCSRRTVSRCTVASGFR